MIHIVLCPALSKSAVYGLNVSYNTITALHMFWEDRFSRWPQPPGKDDLQLFFHETGFPVDSQEQIMLLCEERLDEFKELPSQRILEAPRDELLHYYVGLKPSAQEAFDPEFQRRARAVQAGINALSPSATLANAANMHREQNLRPIFNGIPLECAGPPIEIYERAFGEAKEALAAWMRFPDPRKISPDRKALVVDLVLASTKIYTTEGHREDAIYSSLAKLLCGDKVFERQVATADRSARSDAQLLAHVEALRRDAIPVHGESKNQVGSGDPVTQSLLTHRKHIVSESYAPIRNLSTCPCLHAGIMGGYIAFAGSVFTDQYVAQPLTDLLFIGGNPYTDSRVVYLTGIFDILFQLAKALYAHYASLTTKPQRRPWLPDPAYEHSTPFPFCFLHRHKFYGWQSMEPASYQRSLFEAEYCGKMVLVKFCERYSEYTHTVLDEAGLAPALYHHAVIPGGVVMVVMEYLSNWKTAYEQFEGEDLPTAVVDKLSLALGVLHNENLVFGDLRRLNIMVKSTEAMENMKVDGASDAEWSVKLVDFEWAGKEGQAFYPPLMNRQIPWPLGMRPCAPMLKEHDLQMLNLIKYK